jgi:hypothetical protein
LSTNLDKEIIEIRKTMALCVEALENHTLAIKKLHDYLLDMHKHFNTTNSILELLLEKQEEEA